jgi:hypothetical protein
MSLLHRLALVLVLACPALAGAAGVTVTSGEHDGFTRIALDFGHPVDWQMGRTTDGYALRITGEVPAYDLSAVYQLIGKDRISALWVDKASGDLNLGIGCACFAMPFAFRPSIVVIDIKNGKPPKGSSFENLLAPAASATQTVASPPPRPLSTAPQDPAYDWISARQVDSAAQQPKAADVPVTPLPAGQGLDALRKALIEEMSRGAAAGLIDLSLPRSTTDGMVVGSPSTHVSLGDSPNYATHLGETSQEPKTAAGGTCMPDANLDVSSWAISDRPIAEQIAEPMTGLIGEFDKPDPAALGKAEKFELYLGFGAEARAMMRAFPTDQPDGKAWESMGYILDDRTDQVGAFKTMAACDTAAALWAALSIDDLTKEAAVNSKAIVRAFSALPPHLRRLLGPRLADKLLSLHDDLAARSIRDAVTRLPGEKSGDVTLLEAKLDVAQGDLTAAESRLSPLAKQSGPASEDALAALVMTTATDLKPVAPEQVDALAAVAQERRDGPDAARFDSAVTLGRAAAGQFDSAFKGLAAHPELEGTVWSILSMLGTDDDLAANAVMPAGTAPPPAATAAATRIADRLLGLGFTDQAAAWLAIAPDPDPKLVARLALAQDDGASALRAVAGIDDPAAAELKAQSLTLTGNHRAAADVYQSLGNTQSYWSAEGLAQDWPLLAKDGPAPWSDAAKSLLTEPAPPPPAKDQPAPGPLAEAKAIVSSSESTRAAIDALLSSVPAPAQPTQ